MLQPQCDSHSVLEAATGKLKGKRNDRVTQSLQTGANIKHCHINSLHVGWLASSCHVGTRRLHLGSLCRKP